MVAKLQPTKQKTLIEVITPILAPNCEICNLHCVTKIGLARGSLIFSYLSIKINFIYITIIFANNKIIIVVGQFNFVSMVIH